VAAATKGRVIVRGSRPDEIGQVLDLWRDSRESTGRADDPASLRALFERDQQGLLVAELDGRIVGSLIAVWDGWRGNMYRLTVHPMCRGRGIARRLVIAGEQHLRALGARRISALVWHEDSRAVRLWASAGYEHDEGTGRFVKTIADCPVRPVPAAPSSS
jgi:ribosomal protein S18 acetylase RimI-like enzyme